MRILIDQTKVEEDILLDLIESLKNATGCHVEVEPLWVLEVDDPKVAAILSTVFSGRKEAQTEPSKAEKVAKKRVAVEPRMTVTPEPFIKPNLGKHHDRSATIEILNGTRRDESMKHPAFNKLLRNHDIAVGTFIRHSSKGTLTVIEDATNPEGPYLLVKAADNPGGPTERETPPQPTEKEMEFIKGRELPKFGPAA